MYVYNEDGTIKKSYNDVFDVAVLRNGAVQISMDKEGKETRLLVNEPVEIVQKRVTNIVHKKTKLEAAAYSRADRLVNKENRRIGKK